MRTKDDDGVAFAARAGRSARRLTDTTRRERGAPPRLVHATRFGAAFSHASRSLRGAAARAVAQSRHRGTGWATTSAAGDASAPCPPSCWSGNASSSPLDSEEEVEEAAAPAPAVSSISLARGGGAVIESSARCECQMGGRVSETRTSGHVS